MRISLAALFSAIVITGRAQQPGPIPPPVTNFLEIDVENYHVYAVAGESFAGTKAFSQALGVGDIVRINGQSAKGTFTSRAAIVNYTPTPGPGDTEADTTRTSAVDWIWDIQSSDGASVGTIVATGMSAGPPPPGAPVAVARRDAGALAITGGTGAYLAARGQAGLGRVLAQERPVSPAVDAARRRANAGGAYRFVLHVIPNARPEFIRIPEAWINHSDWSLVTPTKPAKPGEELTAIASGLGPVKALVDPGELFLSEEASVSLPFELLVNNRRVEVVTAVGNPLMYDVYLVYFRLPEDTPPGTASVRMVAGWIAGSEVRINVGRK